MSDPISPSTPNDIAGRSQGKSDIFLRAKDLVHRAYQLPSKQRDQLINAECAGESELRSEVAWMLDALRSPDEHFLESPVLEDGSESISELNVPKGRKYALLKALGEGGSGTVYLAERMENGTRQMVAVKLLSLMALSNKIAVSHFLRERALLAGLNHPGIARLIDAGALEDGQPFLAMEYVEGQTIERYCDNPQLSLSARLHIFLKICDAVQYAHNQLIIHRDIKPSNILVTEQGEPKLVDFGIATHIAGSQSDVTITATRNNMMSVFYASPEQIAGDALATSTDIYSLGVLLYELTTGISPWKKHDVSAALALRSVTHEPELPSYAYKRKQKDGARGGGLWKFNKFPSDLDAILLKALRHRPQDRYLSVEAMVADINRFLGHYAVQARQGQRTYRLQKYLYRHWAAMATTSLVVLLSIGFGIDRSIQLDRTRAEVAKVKEVSNFLSDLLTQPMPEVAQGREVSARALVDHGADRLRRLLDADPATKIALLNTLARTYLGLGVLNQGSELSEQAVMLARESPGISRQQLMDTLLNSANVERLLPRAAMVEKYAREAIDLGERDRTIKPIDLATAMQWLAYAELLQGMPLERIQTDYQKCFSLMNTVAPQSVELALAQTNSLYAMGYLGKPEDGWVFQQSAGRLTEHLLGPSHPETWRSKSISGLLLTQLGEELQADDLLKKVLTAQLSLLG
ncbi:MAG TPA: serine/threonine-protein kinase, partial [Burkholderiaceae bacterium]|nr:serine/threonine-protein kinase [Burkholderiaceae bacterium]